jgi:5-formyltetrahydrofolate cyclo-ligase
MNSIIEKEKKLNDALSELKNLDLSNPDLKNNIDNLSSQKSLLEEHANLTKKLEEIQNKEKLEQKKQMEFSEKIDELNQETDTLLEEIDKWQM